MKKKELLDSLRKDYNVDNWHKISRQLSDNLMLELTLEFDEHPEGFEDGCCCRLCCSYGD